MRKPDFIQSKSKNFQLINAFLLVILFFIGYQNTIAINYRLTQISSKDGLSQQDVECIIQDKQGFIWVGTYDGLNRYDGNNFELLRHIPTESNSISDNRIFCLSEWPARDELWIGTDGGGLNCFNLKTQKTKRFFADKKNKNYLLDNQILCLYQENNNLWIGTAKGLNKITYTSKNEVNFQKHILRGTNSEELSLRINTISNDNQGNIIIGTDYGVYTKNKNENEFKAVKGINTRIRKILKDNVGNIWVISSAEIFYYSTFQQKIINYLDSPQKIIFNLETPENIRSILPITDNLLLLGTTSKIYWLDTSDNRFTFEEVSFSDYSFFENNKLKSFLLDRSMNIWISSEMDGIAKFDLNSKSINHYPLKNSKAQNKIFIQTLIKDYRGRLWIGSNNGIFIEDFKSNRTLKLEQINEAVLDVIEDWNKNIWITTLTDIYFVAGGNEAKTVSIRNQPNLPTFIFDGPYALYADSLNTVWVGMRSGLLQIKRESKSFAFKFNSIDIFEPTRSADNITKLFFDEKSNSLLIGTKNSGLLKANLTTIGDVKNVVAISEHKQGTIDHVWAIFRATNGVIYIGTDSGLKKLMKKNGKLTLEQVSNDSRLQNYKIASIVGDNNHNLWLSTSFGLLCYNIISHEIKQFFNTDGLSSNILTEGSLFDKRGFLYVGSIKGINIIDLSSISTNNVLPEMQFVGLQINNTPVKVNQEINGRVLLLNSLEFTKSIKLKYFENNFTIEFAALHYSNSTKNRFQYKLEGFNDSWIEVSNTIRSANFTNLPAGKYLLKVKSANCDGVWNETPIELSIVISPAPWNTFWAYLLYILVIGIISYYIFKYYTDRQKLKKQLQEEYFEHKKDIEIAEVKLKYHTNITHELRTPLTLIAAPTEELIEKKYNDDFLNLRLDIIKTNADRLLQLIGQFLDFRKVVNDKYSLNISKNNLRELLLNIKNNYSTAAKLKNIDFELYYDLGIDMCWFDKEMVNKICYNLLSNAIKHTPNKGKISIRVTQNIDGTRALISVEDNGAGISENDMEKIFERFYQVQGTIGGTGIGLNLCKQLAMLHQGDIYVKSKLNEGSIFTLDIPITQDAFREDVIYNTPETDVKIETDQIMDDPVDTKPLILIVEDNIELRDYITSLLSEHCKVLVAENGEEGLKIATINIPDIIISDIMMPIMDGIEMTEKCKNNIITSHIPVILLTAKVNEESQIEGLTFGADDYITKPFNPQILKLKVNNLIKLTKKKKEEGGESIEKLNERDQKFISTFEQIVLENYPKYDFGIDKICRLMSISRMQLYRKMTAIVNKKPSELIKEIKMKKAYELMKDKGLNITETMYELNYTSYSHFTKLFTEVNGVSPRNLMGNKK